MTYGLSTRAFSEDGREARALHASSGGSTVRSWRALGEADRIALIERALTHANDRIDGFPLAL